MNYKENPEIGMGTGARQTHALPQHTVRDSPCNLIHAAHDKVHTGNSVENCNACALYCTE